MNHPLLLLLLTAGGIYVGRLWQDDCRTAQAGVQRPGALPGATPAPPRATLIGIAGAWLLLAAETAGEFKLGLAGEQSRMTWLFALYSICAAPIIEEVIFRGWLVITGRGRALLWSGIVAASLLFSALHPFLWRWENNGFELTIGAKGWFSTAVVFVTSLWFYAVRFGPWNPQNSLLPCCLAHAAKNLGVVAIKAASGFMSGLW